MGQVVSHLFGCECNEAEKKERSSDPSLQTCQLIAPPNLVSCIGSRVDGAINQSMVHDSGITNVEDIRQVYLTRWDSCSDLSTNEALQQDQLIATPIVIPCINSSTSEEALHQDLLIATSTIIPSISSSTNHALQHDLVSVPSTKTGRRKARKKAMHRSGEKERKIMHYSSSQKILLVGEGDFSFSACLAEVFGSASNMVATSLDSKDILLSRYTLASKNLKKLEDLGCTLIHRVDANTMGQHSLLGYKLFDRIVFNFPHAGFTYQEHDAFQIELHQDVVRGFFRSACAMLTKNGEIHVTHKTAFPFCRWKIEELAGEVGLRLVEKVPFRLWDYPGYRNKKGSGYRCNRTFPVGECSTYKFDYKPLQKHQMMVKAH